VVRLALTVVNHHVPCTQRGRGSCALEPPATYPDRILPKTEAAAVELKKRTLTNLYNTRPQWLADAHRDLDNAVAAAYGWPADISEEDALAKLLELNLARGAAEPALKLGSDEDVELSEEN
jgi:hypothetical protein